MSSIERSVLVLGVASALTVANVARADEDVRTESRPALAAAGATVFSLSYLAAAAYAAMGYPTVDASDSDRAILFVPWAGPFAMLGKQPTALEAGMFVADGVAQLGGAAMFIAGLARHPVARPKGSAGGVSIVPFALPRSAGIVAAGTF